MANQVQLTKQGYEALKVELALLVDTKRPKLVTRLSYARSQGDLAENNDYQNAKEELEFMDGRISELADVIKNAKVVATNGKSTSVGLGTTVSLKVGNAQHQFEIVGEWEADPVNKKISHTSPLGHALFGKKVGDVVEVEAPAGKVKYKIVKIH